MLNFKLQQQSLFDQVSERGIPLYGTIPTNGVIFSDGTDLSTSGFSFTNLGNAGGPFVLKGVAPASYTSTTTFSMTSTSASFGSAGSHTGGSSGFPYYIQQFAPYWVTPNSYYNLNYATSAAGAHTHTISNYWSGLSSSHDLVRYQVGLYTNKQTQLLPSGSIIFAASKPHLSSTVLGSAYLGMASSTGNINTTVGGSSQWTVSTSSSGDHNHSSTSERGQVAAGGYTMQSYNTIAGAHTHDLTFNAQWSIANYIQLSGWKTTEANLPITSGTIIGWASSSTTLPTGWYFCDGGTYNGFTTPNINSNKHIYSSSSGHGTSSSGTDTFGYSSYSVSDASSPGFTHSHPTIGVSGTFVWSGGYNYSYHSGWASGGWSHSHSSTVPASRSLAANTNSIGLPFIIYLP